MLPSFIGVIFILLTRSRDDLSPNPNLETLADVAAPETFLPPAMARSAIFIALLKVRSVPTD